jgi:hypothetical protein
MEGFPAHNAPAAAADPEVDPPEADPPSSSTPDPMTAVNARMDRLERENAELRRQIPPSVPKELPPADEELKIDWNKELFADPEGTMKKYGDHIEKKVEKRLRTEYQRDKGTSDFWRVFYEKHNDLREDADLVELTLNSNLSTLANMRVEDAYGKLAELTRDRIMRYAGDAVRSRGKKVRTEGAGGPPASAPPIKKEEPASVTSLSDLLRSRKRQRRGQLGAA